MDTAAEIAALRNEVATLKQELNELRRFLSIDSPEDAPTQKSMHVHCSGITVCNPDNPSDLQATLFGGAEGATISLRDKEGKVRILLSGEEGGKITLYSKEGKASVQMADNGEQDPYVAVLHQGNPRAVLKTTREGGAISVVHDDGHARAFLRSEEGKGVISVVSPDMKLAVNLTSEGPDGGGMLTVHHANGRPGIMLVSHSDLPALILKTSQGQYIATLPQAGLEGEK